MKPIVIDKEFEEAAERMISKKQHGDYMRAALAEYRDYQQFMEKAFCDEPTDKILTIRATYRFKKSVWREMEIFGTQTLADLASCIIQSMGWVEDHLHGFWFPDRRRNRIYSDYGIYDENMEDDPFKKLKTQDIPISQIDWERYPVLGFVFDFGDGHEFDIRIKSIREQTKQDGIKSLPILIDQRGVAPEQYPDCEEDAEDILNDDCDICQLQKEALAQGRSLDTDELRKAFQKANNGAKDL